MKKILLSIVCFLASTFFIKAQTLYGTTSNGGNEGGGGTIYKFMPATNNLIVAKSFESVDNDPNYTNLIQASDGNLYGMTANGGSGGYGVIFSLNPSTGIYTKLYDFDNTNGASPAGSLMQASDGKLYGMAAGGGSGLNGVIFSFDIPASAYTKLYDFDITNGGYPQGSLMQASDGKLYGASWGGSMSAGVIFSFDPSSSIYTKLYDFDNTNGANPSGSLIQASDGKLYGMTLSGGSSNAGVIFSFDPSPGTYTKLEDFDGATNGGYPYGSLVQASNGKLYGMTTYGGSGSVGVIFSFDLSASIYTKLEDFDNANGANPYGNLILANDGKLYGMTSFGGGSGIGVIFSFDPSASVYTKLKDFNGIDGAGPKGSLIQLAGGKLYGMTSNGGSSYTGSGGTGMITGHGAIFSFDLSSSTYAKLKDFGANESGNTVSASLIQSGNGKLYGMTIYGGSNGAGVIFSFDPSSSAYTRLKDFDNTNGGNPYGSLMQSSNGKLYGMTTYGGSVGIGVIFSFDASTSTYTNLKDFDYTGGNYPYGSLIQASDGKLYGVTAYGGSSGAGVIFSFDPSSSAYTNLYDFDYTRGAFPYGKLTQASDGKLYGIALGGGASSNGVIFSFDPLAGTYTDLKDFNGADGGGSFGSLMLAGNGKLYGLTLGGGSNSAGVIFSFDPSSFAYTKLYDFDFINGAYPAGNLMQASDGKLYGTTGQGGSNDAGVIFSFEPVASTYTKLKDLETASAIFNIGSAFIEVAECATEVCNGVDDDCDGSIDEGFTDTDGDHLSDCVDPDDDNDGVVDFKDCAPLDNKDDKVLICHNGNTLCVSRDAVAVHLKHGDTEGPCRSNPIAFAKTGNAGVTNNLEVSNLNLIAPAEYNLSSYPNPFVGTSTIKYELPFNSKVSIKIYDVMGRVVTTLVDEDRKAGTYTIDFKADHLSKGSLYYRIIAKSKNKQFKQTKKMIQLR